MRKELMMDPVWRLAVTLRNRLCRERGQTLMEYAVLLAFIALLVVVAVALFGSALHAYWQNNIVIKFPGG
jgi:Flp pilus assembly pilin Flp